MDRQPKPEQLPETSPHLQPQSADARLQESFAQDVQAALLLECRRVVTQLQAELRANSMTPERFDRRFPPLTRLQERVLHNV